MTQLTIHHGNGLCISVTLRNSAKTIKLFWKYIFKQIQLAMSSLAIHGGAYFSAVCWRKFIPISAPEAYEHRACCGLLVFFSSVTLNFVLSFTVCRALGHPMISIFAPKKVNIWKLSRSAGRHEKC